jgi:stress response protein YsnF
MADETVKAADLAEGDVIRIDVKGETLEVVLEQVERAEFDGEDVVVLRFEVEDGFITRRVPPDEDMTRVSG